MHPDRTGTQRYDGSSKDTGWRAHGHDERGAGLNPGESNVVSQASAPGSWFTSDRVDTGPFRRGVLVVVF